MSTIIVLSGLPGSGKSYLVSKSNFHENTSMFIYSTDSYIEQKAEELSTTYTEVFEKHIKEATEYMNKQLELAIKDNKIVIWDQTNTKASKRKWILSKFPESYKKQCFAILPPRNDREWQTIIARIFSRPHKHIPQYVIDSMLESYEQPSLEEGFEVINLVTISGSITQIHKEPNDI